MKKLFIMLLMLSLAWGVVPAYAEEAPAGVTAWLYYTAPTAWPQRKTLVSAMPSSYLTTVDAPVKGPGRYTVSLEFIGQQAQGVSEFNLVLENAETLLPGLLVKITAIRVNGETIPLLADSLYGPRPQHQASGFVPVFNGYWNPVLTPGATGPEGMRTFDGAKDTAHYELIDPKYMAAVNTLEVDFLVAQKATALETVKVPEATAQETAPAVQDVPAAQETPAAADEPEAAEIPEVPAVPEVQEEAPQAEAIPETQEDLGAAPDVNVIIDVKDPNPIPDNATTARIFYQGMDYWPTAVPGAEGAYTTVTVTGEGHYTLSSYFVEQDGWTPQGNGAEKLLIVVEDTTGSAVDGMYLGISEVRVNGEPIDVSGAGYGPTGWDNDDVFTTEDSYSILYDKWTLDNLGSALPEDHTTWNGEEGRVNTIDADGALINVNDIEIDFFFTTQMGVIPPTVKPEVWHTRNTVNVAGLSLKDLGIANDWHNFLPVDISKNGYQVFTMVGADAHIIGNAIVAINSGMITVEFVYAHTEVYEDSQSVKWFTDIKDITVKELATANGKPGNVPVSIQKDLGGAKIAYLVVNNKASWTRPLTVAGETLPRYWRNDTEWKAFREVLKQMLPEK